MIVEEAIDIAATRKGRQRFTPRCRIGSAAADVAWDTAPREEVYVDGGAGPLGSIHATVV